ncbi:MAG TPA: SCO2322 family protein [Nocardioidaceae bacterium]|nr:SCO2322 family protein [Nocardioidaceae bacterium]
MPRATFRRFFGVTAALFLAALVVGSPSTAHAEDGFRYWNYFHLQEGDWAFSQVGPSGYEKLKDGDVEAYRYGTSATSDTDGIPPRADLNEVDFDAICADTDAAAGEKRIGVLLDFGTAADAEGETPPEPRGECAVVEEDANGQQVLEAAADVRAEDGLTCALDGYPVRGCGDPVADVENTDEQPVAFELPSAPDSDDSSETSAEAADEDSGNGDLLWPLVGVGLLVVVIGAAALMLSRRNRSA